MPTSPPKRSRSQVAREYGHPWPWRVPQFVEEYAVDRDVDYRELAKRWGCNSKVLGNWIRRHGFRTENYRAVR